jgi:hypothetical protein
MTRKASRNEITKSKPRQQKRGITASPPAAAASAGTSGAEILKRIVRTKGRWREGLFVVGAVALVSGIFWFVLGRWDTSPEPTPASPPLKAARRQVPRWEPVTPEDHLVDQFMHLKNAKDERAHDLLAQLPPVPEETVAVSPDEAQRIQTAYFLRDTLEIVTIERVTKSSKVPTYRLTTEGTVASPRLTVRVANGARSEQRTMSNPDVLVEVRDGKIIGIRSELQE